MSGKFVRQSKFRHVFGTASKKEKAYLDVKAECLGEGNHLSASTLFWAVAIAGGGGPIVVYPHGKFGRVGGSIPKVNVHKSKVTDLEFSPFNANIIATGSEDCTLRITTVPTDGLTKDITSPNITFDAHSKKLGTVRWHPTASNILNSTSYDNSIKIWDVEQQKELFCNEECGDTPLCAEWNADGSMLGTTCKDKFVRVYDPRTKGQTLKAAGFEGSKGSRLAWASSLNKVITVGFNKSSGRQYSVYDTRKFEKELLTADIDSGAGSMIPYYDADNSILYLVGKGDTSIRYYEIVNDEPYLHHLQNFSDNEAIKGAGFLPKVMCDTKSCEVAVCLRVMKEWIAPVSLQVPRKSEQFQTDIYPDTYAGTPALSASEWAGGQNKAAPTRSMDPKKSSEHKSNTSSSNTSSSSSKKVSYEELEKELAKAQAKIKDLEEQLAKVNLSSNNSSSSSSS